MKYRDEIIFSLSAAAFLILLGLAILADSAYETKFVQTVASTPMVELAKEVRPNPKPALIFSETVKAEDEEAELEVDQEDLEMLALVIYQEAGGDYCCDDCRRMVADVVLNRVSDDRFPDTIEEVLLQEGQYGRLHWTGLVWASRASQELEKDAVDRAYRIAEEVLTGQHSALYGHGYIWQAEFEQGTDVIECHNIYFGK